jgi:hypothetical protein
MRSVGYYLVGEVSSMLRSSLIRSVLTAKNAGLPFAQGANEQSMYAPVSNRRRL